MLSKRFTVLTLLVLSVVLAATDAFAPPSSTKSLDVRKTASLSTATTTQLAERQWNFNEGRSPWGLKRNAEIWNGRLAQMAFVFVFLQELITGQGVIQGIQEGNPFNLACFGLAILSTVGLTAWLAIQGTEEYSDEI